MASLLSKHKLPNGALIIAPTSTLIYWKNEVIKLLPELRSKITMLSGEDKLRRDNLICLIPLEGNKVLKEKLIVVMRKICSTDFYDFAINQIFRIVICQVEYILYIYS